MAPTKRKRQSGSSSLLQAAIRNVPLSSPIPDDEPFTFTAVASTVDNEEVEQENAVTETGVESTTADEDHTDAGNKPPTPSRSPSPVAEADNSFVSEKGDTNGTSTHDDAEAEHDDADADAEPDADYVPETVPSTAAATAPAEPAQEEPQSGSEDLPRKKRRTSRTTSKTTASTKSDKSDKPTKPTGKSKKGKGKRTEKDDRSEKEETPELFRNDQPFTVEVARLKKGAAGFSKLTPAKGSIVVAPKKGKGKGKSKSLDPEEMIAPAKALGDKTSLPPKQVVDREEIPDEAVWRIEPADTWNGLKRYKEFVMGSERFSVGDYVFINHNPPAPATTTSGSPDPTPVIAPEEAHWIARVLEIRAYSATHVFLRVYWMYWPDELPCGRQPYHGKRELVASNHMEVVDALTVNGRAEVGRWEEGDEEEALESLFWRQKLEFTRGVLCEVREHCSCHTYYNPDKRMFGCNAPSCGVWLHEECIISQLYALAHKHFSATTSASPAPTSTTSSKKGRKGSTAKKAPAMPALKELKEKYEVTMNIPEVEDGVKKPFTAVVKERATGEVWRVEKVPCLVCETPLS